MLTVHEAWRLGREADPLPLRAAAIPAEVTAVEGCDCGGVEWHVTPGCSIFRLAPEAARAACAAAEERIRAYTDGLSAALAAAITGTVSQAGQFAAMLPPGQEDT